MKTGTTSYTLALRAIEGLLEEAKADVQLYDLMLNRLTERAQRSLKRRTNDVIGDALQLDRQRRNGNGNGNGHHAEEETHTPSLESTPLATVHPTDIPKKKYKKKAHNRSMVLEARQRTSDFLNMLDHKVARKPEVNLRQVGIAPLMHHGYVKRKGEGFIRTSKPYVVDIYQQQAPA